MTLLDQLRGETELVAETAEAAAVRTYATPHVSLSASRITAAAQLDENHDVLDAAVRWAQSEVGKGGNRKRVASVAAERLPLEFAARMLDIVAGTVAIEVDGRLAYKRRSLLDRARAIWAQLEELGADRSRILLKLPATWEGISAAAKLEAKDGIACEITLVFGMHQLAACAEAGVSVVCPPVGRITDFHKKKDGVEGYPPDDDPGVQRVLDMEAYLAAHATETLLVPCTFRSLDQVGALSPLPRMQLPPTRLEQLAESEGAPRPVARRSTETPAPLEVDAGRFQSLHGADPLASNKLLSGVKNLSWAVVSQERQLVDWIAARQDQAAESSTLALFRIWDYDGDGHIDREEWGGTEEVFNALDRNKDGRISLEEMATGLGAPHPPPNDEG